MATEATLPAVSAGDAERIGKFVEGTIGVTGSTGVTVVIEHVFAESEYDGALDNLNFDITAGEVSANDVARRHATVRELTHRSDDADIDYVIHGRADHRGEELVELVGGVDADYLVVGGRERSPTGKAIPGSIAQEIMFKASCPVAFVHADTK